MGEMFEGQTMTGSIFRKTILTHALFEEVNLGEVVFRGVNLAQATFDDVNLGHSTFDNVNLDHATIRSANLAGLCIEDCYITGLTIDGFRIDELIETERDRRDPERVRLRMADPYDLACVCQVMRRLDEDRASFAAFLGLQEAEVLAARPAPGEWSALECLRHLLFAEDLYLNRWLLHNEHPWLEQGLLPAFLAENPDYQCVGVQAEAKLEEVLAAWTTLHCQTWIFIDRLTPEELRRSTRDLDFGQGDVAHVLQGLAQHDLVHIRQAETAVSLVKEKLAGG